MPDEKTPQMKENIDTQGIINAFAFLSKAMEDARMSFINCRCFIAPVVEHVAGDDVKKFEDSILRTPPIGRYGRCLSR